MLNTPINKKAFAVLFFSLFATITGVGIVVPLLPVYAHSLGASGLYIGLIFGAFSLSRSVMLPYFGRLSDRKGRKPLIVLGLLAYALVSVAFVYSSRVSHLILIRFVQGIASAMIMPVVQAYIGDITPEGKEGATMGMFSMSMFFGLSAGPIAGGILKDHFGMDASFVCMGVLAFFGFALSFFMLPPTKEETALRKGRSPMHWRMLMEDRVITGIFVFRFVYTACIGIIWGFLPVLADVRFSLSSSQTGILVMLGVFISGLMQPLTGYLADRWDRRAMVMVGGALAALGVISYYWAFQAFHLYMGSIVFGLGGGIAMPAIMAVAVYKGQKTDSMGSVIAVLTMGHSLGMLCGALFAGLMMDWFALRDAFTFGGGLMLVGLICFYRSAEHGKLAKRV